MVIALLLTDVDAGRQESAAALTSVAAAPRRSEKSGTPPMGGGVAGVVKSQSSEAGKRQLDGATVKFHAKVELGIQLVAQAWEGMRGSEQLSPIDLTEDAEAYRAPAGAPPQDSDGAPSMGGLLGDGGTVDPTAGTGRNSRTPRASSR